MSITESEAEEFWKGSKGYEFDYFQMGFEQAQQAVGTCFTCEWDGENTCPLEFPIKENRHSFYCASYDDIRLEPHDKT